MTTVWTQSDINRITVEFKFFYLSKMLGTCSILIESQWNLNYPKMLIYHLTLNHINRITVEFK